MSDAEKDVYEYEDASNKKVSRKPILIAAAAGVLGLGDIAASSIGISSISQNENLMQGKPGQGQFDQNSGDSGSFESQDGEQPQFGVGDGDCHRGEGGRHGDDGDGPHGERFGQGHQDGDFDSDAEFEGENS